MSAYQALARKYRPRSFDEMVGQKEVLSALVNSLDSGKLHHAYLLSGTRGVGKTTLARIFAKALNCQQGVSSHPCCQCETCREVENGNFVDLIEIDAASRTKVEDTRTILENVNYKPTSGRYKVYLIDEVHMLSTGSFNALLKTLEEPPEHVKFILATTDPQKIPATVVSRCIQLRLLALTPAQIESQLRKILDLEHVAYDDGSLRLIAQAGNGSMRDALSITDQAVALSGDSLRESELLSMLGCLDRRLYLDLLRAVYRKQGAEMYRILDSIDSYSPDYRRMLDDLISLVHQICMFAVIGGTGVNMYTYDMKELASLASDLPLDTLHLYYQILLNAKRDFIFAPSGRAAMDMVLLRIMAFTGSFPLAVPGASPGAAPEQPPSGGAPGSFPRAPFQAPAGADSTRGEGAGAAVPQGSGSRIPSSPAVTSPQAARPVPSVAPVQMPAPAQAQSAFSPAGQAFPQPGGQGPSPLPSQFPAPAGYPARAPQMTGPAPASASAPASRRGAVDMPSTGDPKTDELLRHMAEMTQEPDPLDVPWDSNFKIIGLPEKMKILPDQDDMPETPVQVANISPVSPEEFKPAAPDLPVLRFPDQTAQPPAGMVPAVPSVGTGAPVPVPAPGFGTVVPVQAAAPAPVQPGSATASVPPASAPASAPENMAPAQDVAPASAQASAPASAPGNAPAPVQAAAPADTSVPPASSPVSENMTPSQAAAPASVPPVATVPQAVAPAPENMAPAQAAVPATVPDASVPPAAAPAPETVSPAPVAGSPSPAVSPDIPGPGAPAQPAAAVASAEQPVTTPERPVAPEPAPAPAAPSGRGRRRKTASAPGGDAAPVPPSSGEAAPPAPARTRRRRTAAAADQEPVPAPEAPVSSPESTPAANSPVSQPAAMEAPAAVPAPAGGAPVPPPVPGVPGAEPVPQGFPGSGENIPVPGNVPGVPLPDFPAGAGSQNMIPPEMPVPGFGPASAPADQWYVPPVPEPPAPPPPFGAGPGYPGEFQSGSQGSGASLMLERRRRNYRVAVDNEFGLEDAISLVRDPWLDLINERIQEPYVRLVLQRSTAEITPGEIRIHLSSNDRGMLTEGHVNGLRKQLGTNVILVNDEQAPVTSPQGQAGVCYQHLREEKLASLSGREPFSRICRSLGCVPEVNNIYIIKKEEK